MSEEHLHAPTGAYALNALPDDEREAFGRHLRDCPACAQEVRELTATAARLGSAVAAPPPDGMKSQVMERIRGVRQLPPHAPPGAGGLVTVRRGRLPHLLLAACVAAVGLGGVAAWQFQEGRQAERRAEQAQREGEELARVLAAADARTVSGTAKGGARATVVVSRDEDRAVFLASGLPELPAGKTYQLWFDDGGRMRPAGLVGEDGAVVMEGGVRRATGMGVTVEPAGGSPQPTSTPLVLMPLPA